MREKVQSNMAQCHFTLFHNLKLNNGRTFLLYHCLKRQEAAPIEENNVSKFGHWG